MELDIGSLVEEADWGGGGGVNAEQEARYRAQVLTEINASVAAGSSRSEALTQFGVHPATYYRWNRLLAKGGIEALKPRYWNHGRRSEEVAKP